MRVEVDLPLLHRTGDSWSRLAAGRLEVFLADHAICEQQAALTALSLIGHYPEDEELVERMTSLAIEEAAHLRKVTSLMRARGIRPGKRRPNPYVRRLKASMRKERAKELKLDRLLVCALIEARSCERFTRLLEVIESDPPLVDMLRELGPAEARHWRMFHRLAARETSAAELDTRWRWWLERERDISRSLGVAATVHG